MFLFYCCLVTFSYSLIIPHRLPSRATFRSSPFKGFNGLRDSATSTRQHSASTKNIIDIAQVQQDPTVWTMPGYRKPLHWVQKVSHLEDALQFYKSNFNFEIYRHEEFASGCEATCNGPYGGAWSKTMMGPPGGEGQSFCLELVYNYGVNRYERGNELRSIGMNIKSFVGDKSLIGVDSAGQKFLDTPDGHWLNLIDDSDDRISVLSTASNSPIQIQDEAIKFISVHVSNLTSSIAYYKDILGANVRINTENSPSSYAVCTWDQIALSENNFFDDIIGHVPVSPTAVILTQLSKGAKMEFEASQGRMAIETDDAAIEKIAHTARISEENGSGKIVHGPVCLEPHGEKVLIVRDEDGHEYCFVDARGFKTCVDVSIKQVRDN